jgi:putative Holliday junction resolvase
VESPQYIGSVLALDVGTKTIGLAGTDPMRMMALPLHTLARQSVVKDADALALLCKQRRVSQLVVGLPLELDGTEGRSARLARQVGDALAQRTALPLAYVDERFSTVEAKNRLREAGLNERQQRSVVDAAAAAVILEDWMAAEAAASSNQSPKSAS